MKPCLSIQNPCPMRIRGAKDQDNSFHCKSCNHTVQDFRHASNEEIIAALSKGKTCGIFYEDQLKPVRHSAAYRFRFAILAALAFFGFQVKPLNAAPVSSFNITMQEENNIPVQAYNAPEPEKKTQKIKKSKKRKKIRLRRRTMGCPDF